MPEHDEPQEPTDDERSAVRRGADDLDDVRAAQAGDGAAFARLYERWFDRVLDLAFRVVRDRQIAADIAQDSFLSAHRNLASLADPYSFGGWLLRIARNRAYDRAERERRSVAVDDTQLAIIERAGGTAMSAPSGFAVEDRLARASRPEEAAEDNELVALLWDAADALGDRDRDVLDLHLRHGLDPAEIAEVIGINRNAANQTMHRVRQRLAAAIGARVLWRSGSPKCAALRAELDAADLVGFGSEASRLIDRHASSCEACDDQRRTRLDPAVLFAAAPILSVPALKAKVAAALAAEGVPTDLDAAGGDADSRGDDSVGRERHERDGSRPQGEEPVGRAGDETAELASGVAEPSMSRRARRSMAVGALVALLCVVVAIGFTVLPSDETAVETATSDAEIDEPLPTSPMATNPSTAPTTTRALVSPTTLDPRGATSTTQAVIVDPTSPPTEAPDPTTAPPAPTTTVPPTPSATLRISRTTVAMPGYSPSAATAPRLTWSTSNVATVEVSGPNLTSADLDGESVVCPGISGASYCTLTPSIGTVTYRLRGYDISGEQVVERSVTLTVTV